MNRHEKAKTVGFLCKSQISFHFFYTKLYIKMILNYVMTYIFFKTFLFMQNVCKMA